jgi:exonuclease-1
MGISELLKIMKPIIIEKHLSDFKGKTAAVDMMAWIYRGVYASAVDIGHGKESDLYLNFPLKMLALLKSFDIECIAVFDGRSLKAKESVEEVRNENKVKNLELAQKLLSEGKDEESRKIFRRALKIKSKMINTCIEILKSLGVKIIVAPYEADSQIAFLCKNGLADFAITEDSDLIPFGVDKMIFKLNANGYGSFLDMEYFRNTSAENINDPCLRILKKIYNNHLRLVEFCVMLGCDYLPSVKGYGVKTALNLFQTYEKMETVLHQMKFTDKFKKRMPDDYQDKVKKCVALFFLQCVYNPIENKLQPLTEIENVSNNSESEKQMNETIFKYSKITNNSIPEKDSYFGNLYFESYKEFCNGEIDIKTMKKEKKLESEEVINKYINRFKYNFKNKSSIIKASVDNKMFEEEINLMDFTEIYPDSGYNDTNNHNENKNLLNLDESKEFELEIQECIKESLKTEKKKQKRTLDYNSCNQEMIDIFKIQESLNSKINNEGRNSTYVTGKLNTPKETSNDIISVTEEDKPIKSLFDIMEREKGISSLTSNHLSYDSPLK